MAVVAEPSGFPEAAKTSKKLALYFSAQNIAGTVPKTMLMAFTHLPNGAIIHIGQTEVVETNEPEWKEPILLEYESESTKVDVLIGNFKDRNVGLLAHYTYTVSEMFKLGTSGNAHLISHTPPWGSATLKVRVETVSTDIQNSKIVLSISASDLDKKDVLGKSDPYFFIRKELPGVTMEVYKSEVVKKSLNPKWEALHTTSVKLCNCGLECELSFEVWDWNKMLAHEMIGTVKTSLAEILAEKKLTLFQDEKKKAKGSSSGALHISVSETPVFSLLDFLAAGLKLNLVVGIDWTETESDRGQFSKSFTLHGKDGGKTKYTDAVSAVLPILLPSMHSQSMAAYGSGGRMIGVGSSKFFPLTRKADQVEVSSVAKLIEEYFACFDHVSLDRHSSLAPLVAEISKMVLERTKAGIFDTYTVLVIFTHGQIEDKQSFAHELVRASTLPLSIIVVGLGKGEFSSLRALDDPKKYGLPRSAITGETAERDVLTLVELESVKQDKEWLTGLVLSQLSCQVADYMKIINRTPKTFTEASK